MQIKIIGINMVGKVKNHDADALGRYVTPNVKHGIEGKMNAGQKVVQTTKNLSQITLGKIHRVIGLVVNRTWMNNAKIKPQIIKLAEELSRDVSKHSEKEKTSISSKEVNELKNKITKFVNLLHKAETDSKLFDREDVKGDIEKFSSELETLMNDIPQAKANDEYQQVKANKAKDDAATAKADEKKKSKAMEIEKKRIEKEYKAEKNNKNAEKTHHQKLRKHEIDQSEAIIISNTTSVKTMVNEARQKLTSILKEKGMSTDQIDARVDELIPEMDEDVRVRHDTYLEVKKSKLEGILAEANKIPLGAGKPLPKAPGRAASTDSAKETGSFF